MKAGEKASFDPTMFIASEENRQKMNRLAKKSFVDNLDNAFTEIFLKQVLDLSLELDRVYIYYKLQLVNLILQR